MAGGMLLAFGLLGARGRDQVHPVPVTLGFTSGIALIIFSGEVKDFLGLPMGSVPVDFLGSGGRSRPTWAR